MPVYPDFRELPQRPDLKDMLLRVESLGISCELGLVQRHCHAEPLGLFRFGFTPFSGLIDALDSAFADISNPDCLVLHEGFAGEWITRHSRYGFEFHTQHVKHEHSEDAVRARISRHFAFLADKLMADLAEGSKLFVYRPASSEPPGAAADLLLRALRRHGDSTLVWVCETSDAEAVGTAAWVSADLMVGYLDHYADVTFAAGASFDAWVDMVGSALKLAGRRD